MFPDFFIWLLSFVLFTGLVLLLNYWIYLFQSQDSYQRKEILDILHILRQELGRLLGGKSGTLRLFSFLGGIVMAWGLSLLGGLLSPDISPAPDYASAQFTNYFFQSFLFVLVLHLVWPLLRDASRYNDQEWFGRLLGLDLPFLFSFSISLAALNLTLWGLYHEMHFLYCFMNILLCISYVSYRLRTEEEKAARFAEESARSTEANGV